MTETKLCDWSRKFFEAIDLDPDFFYGKVFDPVVETHDDEVWIKFMSDVGAVDDFLGFHFWRWCERKEVPFTCSRMRSGTLERAKLEAALGFTVPDEDGNWRLL